jgi:5-methylcytosine-specific restriction endonuclease McrA
MLNYTLIGLINPLNQNEQNIIVQNPPIVKDNWTRYQYEPIKQRLKRELYLNQLDRCAYCRREVEAAAKYEPLDHIVAQSKRPEWMLEPKNLIVVCDSCNNLKNAEQTLTDAYVNTNVFPNNSNAFLVFNPHFDIWEEHLNYEEDIFITPIPQSKGANTIEICKLYRFNVIVNRAKELKLAQKEPINRIFNRLINLDSNSQEAKRLIIEYKEAFEHFHKRVQDNPNYN